MHPIVEFLTRHGYQVRLRPPDTIHIKPVAPRLPEEKYQAVVEAVRQRKPEILEALRQQEFNRLYALVQASVSQVAEIYPEGGIAEAKRLGLWPRLMALESAIDRAVKNLDEPALLGALEAFEKVWREVRDATIHLRRPARQVEATA